MRSSVINNKRGSVISDKRDNTNCYNNNGNDDGNGDEKVGSGDSAPLTPTLSLLHTLNTLLITYLSFIVLLLPKISNTILFLVMLLIILIQFPSYELIFIQIS